MEAQLKLKETKKQLQKIIKEVAEALQPLSVEMAGQEQIQSLEIEHQRLRNPNQELKIASEINKLTAEVIQAPLKIIRKGEKCEQDIEAIEGEPPLLPLAKKAKHGSQGLPELEAENFNPKNWKDQANTISSLQLLVELLISVLREVPPRSHPNLVPEFSRHRLCAHLQ